MNPDLRHLSAPPPASRWVVVADRAADMFEHLQQCRQLGLGFVVRAAQNRVVVDPVTGQAAGRLYVLARARPRTGHFSLTVPARQGQPARHAELCISSTPLLALRAPSARGGQRAPPRR